MDNIGLKKKYSSLKMDNIGLKKKYSSLKMDNITVIKLKTLANQRGIKGYYKLEKAELIPFERVKICG